MRNFLALECIFIFFLFLYIHKNHLKFYEDILLLLSDDDFVIVCKGKFVFLHFFQKSDTVKINVIWTCYSWSDSGLVFCLLFFFLFLLYISREIAINFQSEPFICWQAMRVQCAIVLIFFNKIMNRAHKTINWVNLVQCYGFLSRKSNWNSTEKKNWDMNILLFFFMNFHNEQFCFSFDLLIL